MNVGKRLIPYHPILKRRLAMAFAVAWGGVLTVGILGGAASGERRIEFQPNEMKLLVKFANMSLEELMRVDIRPRSQAPSRKSRRPRKSRPQSLPQPKYNPSLHLPTSNNRSMIA